MAEQGLHDAHTHFSVGEPGRKGRPQVFELHRRQSGQLAQVVPFVLKFALHVAGMVNPEYVRVSSLQTTERLVYEPVHPVSPARPCGWRGDWPRRSESLRSAGGATEPKLYRDALAGRT